MSPTENRKLAIKRAIIVVGVVVFAAIAWSGYQVWSSWNDIETVPFDPDAARDLLPGTTTTIPPTTTVAPSTTSTSSTSTTTTSTIPTLFLDRGKPNTFLIMGTDDSTKRADVILLVMLPKGTGDAVMVSIPRDLYVNNPCWGFNTKINENLWGCESVGVSGPEQLAVAIEDFAGVEIDHFVRFTFPDFRKIIDRIGGIEVCVGQYPIRDLNEDFDNFQLPAGCSVVNGEKALSWVRSRHTQELGPSGWRGVAGVSDFTRNQRQQDMLLTALDKLKGIRSLPELQGLVEDVSNAFVIDDGLSLGDAIALLWDARSISSDNIYRATLDARVTATEAGASIVVLDTPFPDSVIAAYPAAFQFFASWGDA